MRERTYASGCNVESRVMWPAREARSTMPNRIETNPSQPSPPTFGIFQRKLDTHTSVISVEGELDLSAAPRLKWMLIDALEAGHSELVVDLSLATFIDSTALSVLVGVTRRLDVGARLVIVCARLSVLRIFEFAGLDGAFAIFPTLDEALAYAPEHEARTS
jgi:anti-sigma B factor antagonist